MHIMIRTDGLNGDTFASAEKEAENYMAENGMVLFDCQLTPNPANPGTTIMRFVFVKPEFNGKTVKK